MLKPKIDRLNYSEILKPPEGCRLWAAVGTTYSLDLETLVAASLPLAIAENPEQAILENPICVMHAIRKISDRIVLFCEDGQTKLPHSPSKLLSFIERMIVRVDLPKHKNEKFYPSFHPKMWFVDFVHSNGEHQYRLIVLSRNLTFDHSWDVGIVLESDKYATGKQRGIRNQLSAFLSFLRLQIPGRTGDEENNRRRQIIQDMINALPGISFAYAGESDWEEVELLPLGIGTGATRIKDYPLFCQDENDLANFKLHDAIVIAPFISRTVIQHLGRLDRRLANGTSALITRVSELRKIASDEDDVLGAFTDNVYVLKDKVVDGEYRISDDSIDEPHRQDLHAKVFMWRRYDCKEVFVGSMNASSGGLYRNVELVLHLKTRSRCVSGARLLTELFGEESSSDNPFKKAEFDVTEEFVEDDPAKKVDQILKEFCRIERFAVAARTNDGLYNITVSFAPPFANESARVYLRPLHWKGAALPVKDELSFHRMAIDDLSMYYEVSVRMLGQRPLNRLILIPTRDIPDERDNVITNSVLKDVKALSVYLMMALSYGNGRNAVPETSDIVQSLMTGKGYGGVELGLYEKMLRAAVTNPEGFADVNRVLSLVADDDDGKRSIKDLYQLFYTVLTNEGVLRGRTF